MKTRNDEKKMTWDNYIKDELKKGYMLELNEFLEDERRQRTIYPKKSEVFHAFNQTPLQETKIIIIGQDPYHGEGQAHGLAFSVNSNVKIPPSLRNIFKEISTDLGIEMSNQGNLDSWAKQGVLLLNSVLTVEESKAGAHRKKGWEKFTDKMIEVLDKNQEGLVFLLWGAPAQKKASKIDKEKHLVLKAPHPSPLSSYRGFFGCRHFSKANDYLVQNGKKPINWKI